MEVKEKIIAEIRKIYDPEVPVNIYELGLIYDIQVIENKAKIKMTLTSLGKLSATGQFGVVNVILISALVPFTFIS